MTHDWRGHAVCERGRELDELTRMLGITWRLNEVERKANRGAVLALNANQVLTAAALPNGIPAASLSSLARVGAEIHAHRAHEAA